MYMVHKLGIKYGVIRVSGGANIPADVNNKDWQDFLKWQAAGNTPLVYDATKL